MAGCRGPSHNAIGELADYDVVNLSDMAEGIAARLKKSN
jgi:hypothetical protein